MEEKKIKELESGTIQVVETSSSIVIKDQDSYENASKFLKSIKDMKKTIGETFDPIVKKAHEAHKEATAQRKKHLDPLDKAEQQLRFKITAWVDEQQRIKKLEEDRLRKIQEEKERKEREKAEEERKKQEAIDKQIQDAKDEEERKRLEKEKEKSIKKEEKAEQKAENASMVVPTVKSNVSVTEGQSFATVWTFEIVDEALIPDTYKTVNEVAIGKVVKALKDKTNIAGIRVYSKQQLRQK